MCQIRLGINAAFIYSLLPRIWWGGVIYQCMRLSQRYKCCCNFGMVRWFLRWQLQQGNRCLRGNQGPYGRHSDSYALQKSSFVRHIQTQACWQAKEWHHFLHLLAFCNMRSFTMYISACVWLLVLAFICLYRAAAPACHTTCMAAGMQ